MCIFYTAKIKKPTFKYVIHSFSGYVNPLIFSRDRILAETKQGYGNDWKKVKRSQIE